MISLNTQSRNGAHTGGANVVLLPVQHYNISFCVMHFCDRYYEQTELGQLSQ